MIYKYFVAFILTFSSISGFSQKLLENADSAFNQRDYQKAIQLYQQSMIEDGYSTYTYYNLGNAYYRADSLGKAILNYERALRLDPTNDEARQNLEFVNSRIIDRQSPQGKESSDNNASVSYFNNDSTNNPSGIYKFITPNQFALIGLLIFLLALLLFALYYFSNTIRIKKLAFFSSLFLLILSFIDVFFVFKSANYSARKDMAIIMNESSQLSTSPSVPLSSSEQVVLLHEGTKLHILDSIATPNNKEYPLWYEVQIDDNISAWIPASDVEII